MKQVLLPEQRLLALLKKIKDVRVGVLGDVCLDLYWYADMKRSRLSRETPHFPLPVISEKYSPGACGNVIQNLAALEIGKILPISLIGTDWRGYLLSRCFSDLSIDCSHILQTKDRITPGYCKPIRMGISQVQYEDPRLDFENFSPVSSKQEELLIAHLNTVASQVDILAVSDQFAYGIITEPIRERLSQLGESGLPIIVDSRDRIRLFENVIIKPNEVEAALAVGKNPSETAATPENYRSIALSLSQKNGKPAVVTLGDKGALWCGSGIVDYAPSKKAKPPVDIVGAGDTFLSAFCAALGAGAAGGEATAFANLASGVTVRKLGTTGTASPQEILALYKEN